MIPYKRAEAAVREAVEGFGRHDFGLWISERRQRRGDPIGFCGLRHLDDEPEAQILYGISPPEWGRGFATELALAVPRYAIRSEDFRRVLPPKRG